MMLEASEVHLKVNFEIELEVNLEVNLGVTLEIDLEVSPIARLAPSHCGQRGSIPGGL